MQRKGRAVRDSKAKGAEATIPAIQLVKFPEVLKMLALTKPWSLIKFWCTILPSLSEPFYCCRGQAKAQRWRFAVQTRWLPPGEVKPQRDSSPRQMEKATEAEAGFCWSAKHPHAEQVLFIRANEFWVQSKQVYLKIEPSWSTAIHRWASPLYPQLADPQAEGTLTMTLMKESTPQASLLFFYPEEMQINLTLSSYLPAWSKCIKEVVSSKMQMHEIQINPFRNPGTKNTTPASETP